MENLGETTYTAEEIQVPAEETHVEEPAPAEPVVDATQDAPAHEEPVQEDAGRTYTVEPGDNLSAIGEQFGVDYLEIARINGIDNPDLIFPGQVLRIP